MQLWCGIPDPPPPIFHLPPPLQVWPQLGLLWAAVAKLEHLQEQPQKALAAAEQALHILTTTHGGSGPAAEAMRRVLLEARQEAAMRSGGGGRRPALGPGANQTRIRKRSCESV